jgi:arsenate reductase (thioredoxin)
MRELGIDLSERRPQRLSTELAEQADVVVTMGCGDAWSPPDLSSDARHP